MTSNNRPISCTDQSSSLLSLDDFLSSEKQYTRDDRDQRMANLSPQMPENWYLNANKRSSLFNRSVIPISTADERELKEENLLPLPIEKKPLAVVAAQDVVNFTKEVEEKFGLYCSSQREFQISEEDKSRLLLILGEIALKDITRKGGKSIKDKLQEIDIEDKKIFYRCGFLEMVENRSRFTNSLIQKFFAAFYLATSKPVIYKSVMNNYKNKYHPEMQLVWAICLNLLEKRQPEEADDNKCRERVAAFFCALYEQPRVLVERCHDRLALLCLNAIENRELLALIDKKFTIFPRFRTCVDVYLHNSHAIDLSLEWQCLSVIEHSAIIPTLIKTALKTSIKDTNSAAKEALLAIGVLAMQVLTRELESPDENIRKTAVEILGEAGPAANEESISCALIKTIYWSRRSDVRRAGIDALFKIGAMEALMDILKTSDENIQGRVAEGFIKVGKDSVPYLIKALPNPIAVKALVKLGSVAVPSLKDEVWSSQNDGVKRAVAAEALGQIGQEAEKAVVMLAEVALEDPDPEVRIAGATALGKIGLALEKSLTTEEKIVPTLMKILEDPDPLVKSAATRTLGRIGAAAKKAVAPLIKCLEDLDEDVRWEAAIALKQIKETVKSALTETLEDPSHSFGKEAKYVLERVETEVNEALKKRGIEGEQECIDALDDQRSYFQRRAKEALVKNGEKGIPALTKNLKQHQNPRVRVAIVEILGKITPTTKEAVEALVEAALKDTDERIRRAALDEAVKMGFIAEPFFVQAIPNKAAVHALIEIGSETVVEELSKALLAAEKSQDIGLLAYALGSIRITTKESVNALIQIALKHPDPHARLASVFALGEISNREDEAVSVLIELLEDHDENIRSVALHALMKKKETALPALRTAFFNHKNRDVREGALYVIEKIAPTTREEIAAERDNRRPAEVRRAIEILKHPSRRAREEAALLLKGATMKAEEVQSLIELSKHLNNDDKKRVEEVLGGVEYGVLLELALHSDKSQDVLFAIIAIKSIKNNDPLFLNEAEDHHYYLVCGQKKIPIPLDEKTGKHLKKVLEKVGRKQLVHASALCTIL